MAYRSLEEEILSIRVLIEKTTNKELKKILQEQKKQLEKLRAEVGSIYMQYSGDEGLNMSASDKIRTNRRIEKSLVDMGKVLAATEIAIVGATLYNNYKEGYYRSAYTLDKGVEVGINYKILRPEFIDSVVHANFHGQTFSDRIWKQKDELMAKLYDVIGHGITEGKSIQKMSKEIKDTFGVSAFSSQRIIRSETARIVSNAQLEIYNNSDVVDKVMWSATLDEKTNPEDGQLDSTIWNLNDKSKPSIPLHPNCRCAWIPIVDDWKPRVRRDNITGEVIPYMTYNEWKEVNKIS